MLRIRPMTARLGGKVSAPRCFFHSSFAVEEISPASTMKHFASMTLPDEYERIKAALPGLCLQDEIKFALGSEGEHPATLSYKLGRALIADGTVYYAGGYEVLKAKNAKPFIEGKPVKVGRAQLCNSSLTENFFGHWLSDTPALIVLSEERDLPAIAARTDSNFSHRDGYLSMIGTPLQQLRLAEVEELWVVDDRPMNQGRAARLREVRRRLRTGRNGKLKRVIIDRGLTGTRRHLINAPEIWNLLVKEGGFELIDPTALSADQLVDALSGAEIVIGVEGSALFHAIFAVPEGAVIFPIMPPQRFCTAVKWYTDMVGIRYGFTVADGNDTDFRLDPDRMRRALHLILSEDVRGGPAV